MLGIELSKWNGEWDAARTKSAGAHFAFIQASQATHPDPFFQANWTKARDANLFRGAFHCLSKSESAHEQAEFFIELLSDDQGELPVAVQIEPEEFEASEDLAIEYLQEFIERVKAHGMTTLIASPAETWVDPDGKFMDWTQFPLWVTDCASETTPRVPSPWVEWAFWKFSEKGDGEAFGTESFDVHLNTFHGTLNDLTNLIKSSPSLHLENRILNLEKRIQDIDHFVSLLQQPVESLATQNVEKDDAAAGSRMFAICNTNSLNVRTGPDLSHPVIDTLHYNQRVQVVDRQEKWVQILRPEGWISEKYVAFE